MNAKDRMAIRFKIEDMLMEYEMELSRNWYNHTYERPNRLDYVNRIIDEFYKKETGSVLNIEDSKADIR